MPSSLLSSLLRQILFVIFVFFFIDTATSDIYTLSLHDALPISRRLGRHALARRAVEGALHQTCKHRARDRKSTRLNSSHANISYAVFCLKKKKNTVQPMTLELSPIITEAD